MKRVSFKTLGCRLNQYETDALVTSFHRAGYKIVGFEEEADVSVINTCTVTNQSDQKSRNIINAAARRNKNALIIACGCMVDNYKEKLESQENITYVVDNDRKSQIVSLVESHFAGEIVHPENYGSDRFNFDTVQQSLHTRTSIKIQDGCDNFCSYCIIPSVRGAGISRSLEDILDNVRSVVSNGFKEVVLTGVNIGRYDYEGNNFEDAVAKVLELDGDFRVRISSLEPDGFSGNFRDLFLHPKMVPHLHLCIQSGSEKILKEMKRMYTAEHFLNTMQGFKELIPDFNFTTDVIVGFPGESDEDFQETMDFLERAKFTHIHTFRFSRRTGTKADLLKNQVNGKIMSERSELVRLYSEKIRREYLLSMIGKRVRVLIEKVEKGIASGYGEHYVPVKFGVEDAGTNRFENVELTGVEGDSDLYMIGRRL